MFGKETNKVIQVSPMDTIATEEDVEDLCELIDQVVKAAKRKEKIDADFYVDVVDTDDILDRLDESLDDINAPELIENECEHVFGVVDLDNNSEVFMDLRKSRPISESAIIRCVRCKSDFSLFRSAEEMSKIAWPMNTGE